MSDDVLFGGRANVLELSDTVEKQRARCLDLLL